MGSASVLGCDRRDPVPALLYPSSQVLTLTSAVVFHSVKEQEKWAEFDHGGCHTGIESGDIPYQTRSSSSLFTGLHSSVSLSLSHALLLKV